MLNGTSDESKEEHPEPGLFDALGRDRVCL